jgi:hypothetical protein
MQPVCDEWGLAVANGRKRGVSVAGQAIFTAVPLTATIIIPLASPSTS